MKVILAFNHEEGKLYQEHLRLPGARIITTAKDLLGIHIDVIYFCGNYWKRDDYHEMVQVMKLYTTATYCCYMCKSIPPMVRRNEEDQTTKSA